MLETENLVKLFPATRTLLAGSKSKRFVHAVDDISFEVKMGEILGVAGESGCGKTTTGRLLTLLETPTSGKILFRGTDIQEMRARKEKLRNYRRRIQIIFQNPYDSLDPRYTVHDSIVEPMLIHRLGSSKSEREEMVLNALDEVELEQELLHRYPHELSGGQRQRVSVARTITLQPELIVADEPVSMLDVSVRLGVLNMMQRLRREFHVAFFFITHDMSVLRYMSDRIMIMYLGKIVEKGEAEEVLLDPRHPYTRLLTSAVPIANPIEKRQRVKPEDMRPSAIDLPKGCRFNTRCPYAVDLCKEQEPDLEEKSNGRQTACHLF